MGATEIKRMCPHCGWVFAAQRAWNGCGLVPPHHYPDEKTYCPGSEQAPRNPESDRRVLWKDIPPETAGEYLTKAEAGQSHYEKWMDAVEYMEAIDASLDGIVPAKTSDGSSIWLRERIALLVEELQVRREQLKVATDRAQAHADRIGRWRDEIRASIQSIQWGGVTTPIVRLEKLLGEVT